MINVKNSGARYIKRQINLAAFSSLFESLAYSTCNGRFIPKTLLDSVAISHKARRMAHITLPELEHA